MQLKTIRLSAVFLFLFSLQHFAPAQNPLYPQTPASAALPAENWKGTTTADECLVVSLPGAAIYTVPAGSKGWYLRGLMREHGGVIDARQWYGISFNIELQQDELFEIKLTLKLPEQKDRHNLPDSTQATVHLKGKGWHTVTVPFSSFDYNRGQMYMLKFIQQIAVAGSYNGNNKSFVRLKNTRLVKGNPLHLSAVVRSKPGEADSTVNYIVQIINSSDTAQQVNLFFRKSGWEGMQATVTPASLSLNAGETKTLNVRVQVPALAPGGSQEMQTLVAATTNGALETSIDFITLRKLRGPYIIHTEDGWKEVLAKTKQYAWAKKSLDDYIKKADEFTVPETPPGNIGSDAGTPAVFKSYIENQFWPVAIAYKLTGEIKYAEKLALLLRRLSSPDAYPTTLHANSQGIPQEGGFWDGVARSYDLIKDAGVLSSKDKEQIEHSMRLYIYTIEDGMGDGGISNWSVFNLGPAMACALALQDMHHFNYLLNGPGGLKDHLRYGLMDDGWWYEVSLSYNIGCAEAMTSIALAAKPFGIDLLHEKIPASLTQKVGLRPFEFENFQGMAFGKFGPLKKNVVTIKDMWDGIVAYPDYRGIMFGMGDGHEQKVGSGPFELAYYAFRDTAYAAILKQADSRDLLHGVPVLPGNTPAPYTQSAHSDNAGVSVLRSQTKGRHQREQIQAALKYGTHGGYHGHFDRASLLSLMRYGRSFWNPETSWYGYGSYMYKWWVQTSMASNMVVVDGKMQEPKETAPLLFHSGAMMQVMAVETDARWSHPPYFGGYAQIERVRSGDAPHVPVPAGHPPVAAVTGYTEPVLQRRLMVVTDDYVVLADYLKAQKEHTFDNLVHLRGAQQPSLPLIARDALFDSNPLSSGQFITNVSRYKATNGSKLQSTMQASGLHGWESGGFNGYQELGPLHIDVYNVWPQKAELRFGTYPYALPVSKKLKYEIKADDKLLAQDSLGVWILGKKEIDVPLINAKHLQLKTFVRENGKLNTLFWANARIVTSLGREIPLSQLKINAANIIPAPQAGKDYKGGPVTIEGIDYENAIAAEPEKKSDAGVLSIDLSRLNAVRFKATIGGDFPLGEADQVRKTISYRITGKEARYLTVLEPYETKSLVKKVTATGAGELMVELTDGRVQRIRIAGLDSKEGKVKVSIEEEKEKKVVRSEETN